VKEALTESPVWFRAALATTFTAFAGWQLWALGFGEPVLVAKAGLLKDDAFFYNVLVDNLQKHGFFTLDGEMHTNGFQPLWMFVLLALKSVLPSVDALRLLQGMSWASWLLFSWGAVWLLSSGTPFGATVRSLIVGGLLINNSRVQTMLVVGLEVPLALALIVWALVYVESLSQKTNDEHTLGVGAGAALGALGGLIFLARTDLDGTDTRVVGLRTVGAGLEAAARVWCRRRRDRSALPLLERAHARRSNADKRAGEAVLHADLFPDLGCLLGVG
jgi:hypothetical protein